MPIDYGSNNVATSGNIAVSGVVTATSGVFNNLTLGGTVVSISGHTHTASNITDFNSGVSGLLPTIANSGDNRLLTSDGTSTGINAESNLTFSNNNLTIASTGTIASSSNENPQINIYSSVNESARIRFISSDGQGDFGEPGDPTAARLSIIYDEEGDECVILSYENFRIQAFAPIVIDSQTSGVFVNTAAGNSLYVNSVPVSVSGHTHVVNDITDFGAGVSGLLPSVSGSGSVVSSFEDNVYTISVTGVQPSGNYADQVHSHVVADITDFDVGVSGLLPTIANSGDNRLLTSDGTSTGIDAKSNLTFDDQTLIIQSSTETGIRVNQFTDLNAPPRLTFRKTRGSEASPQIANINDGIFAIRAESIDYSGNVNILGGIRMDVTEPASPTSLNPATKIFLRTSSGGDNLGDKTLTLNSDGTLVNTGTIKVFDTPVSLEGHNHTSSQITDFSLGGATDNQYLQYNASQNLWKPTSSGSFSDIFVNTPNSVGTFTMKNETTSPGPSLQLNVHANNGASSIGASLPRLTARKSRGTENSPIALNDNEPLLSIRTENIDFNGNYSLSTRITAWSDGVVSAENIYQPTRLELSTSSGTALNNTLSLDSNGKLSWNGHVVIDHGLDAPTPVHDLGSVSGNVSISYSVDKQIQLLTLTGLSTNFILGENWPIVNKSVDILLEITVASTTSVLWGLVDEWYNAAPAFISNNKYIVLLRSVGNTIQGHYIGEKIA